MIFKKKEKKEDIIPQDTSLLKEAFIFLWEIIKVVIISLIIILPVRYFVIQPFYVKGASMEPNYYDHEYLIINEISYYFTEPERGEVVVFKYPNNLKEYFIKRIIGLPGERVEISNGQIKIYNQDHLQGMVLDEGYLDAWQQTTSNKNVQLKDGEYYMLGDNRLSSLDSRSFGPVKEKHLIGKVLFRGWPISRIGFPIALPEYNL